MPEGRASAFCCVFTSRFILVSDFGFDKFLTLAFFSGALLYPQFLQAAELAEYPIMDGTITVCRLIYGMTLRTFLAHSITRHWAVSIFAVIAEKSWQNAGNVHSMPYLQTIKIPPWGLYMIEMAKSNASQCT